MGEKPLLFALPLEILCIIFDHFSPNTSYYFSLVSRYTSNIFNFRITKILDHTITSWGCLIFKCPECKLSHRGRDAVSINVYYLAEGKLNERLYMVCKRCRRIVKRENAKFIYGLLKDTITTGDLADLVSNGIHKFEECSGNKVFKYMRDIAVKVLSVA
jgi:hypothetical protein